MAWNIWRGIAQPVAQVWSGKPTTATSGHTYIVTLTDPDDGSTEAFTYTVTAADTSLEVLVQHFAEAWNASNKAAMQRLVASYTTGMEAKIILTAKVAGQPFSAAASGTGTWTDTGNTTSSSGPNDYGIAENWSLNHVPTTGEDVYKPAGSPAILYGLNQASIAIGTWERQAGDSTQVGRIEEGKMFYLKIDPDALIIRGGGTLCAIDIGSAAIAPMVDHSGSGVSGRHAVYLKGSAITTLEVRNGDVGLNRWPGNTSTVTAGFSVTGSGSYLTIGTGTTVTGTTCRVEDGYVVSYVSVPTVKVYGTGVYVQEDGNWTTLDAFGNGCTVKPNNSGTYATTSLHPGAICRNDERFNTKTFTTLNLYRACVYYDPAGLITVGTKNYPNGQDGIHYSEP